MEISISNYKSIKKVRMKLGRVTVLLGPPFVGKSNLLEGIALATYFDRYVFVDRQPLSKLVRTDKISDLFNDLAKTVEISISTDEWYRSLRIYFLVDTPYIDLSCCSKANYSSVPLREADNDDLFMYNKKRYQIQIDQIDALLKHEENVVARLYGFDRFKDDIINSMINGSELESPRLLLREDGKNIGAVAKNQLEVIRDVNAELAELSRVEVKLLDDGRVVVFDNDIAMKPSAISDSVFRILYNLLGLSSATFFAKFHGLEGRTVVLLEEPEGQLFPQ
ncbi:MAG: hypothetical protein ACO2PN_27385, partial [Pyrobaculum sp.]